MSNLGSFFTWGLRSGLAVPLMRDRCAELCGSLPGGSRYRPDLRRGWVGAPGTPAGRLAAACLFLLVSSSLAPREPLAPHPPCPGPGSWGAGWVSTWRAGIGSGGFPGRAGGGCAAAAGSCECAVGVCLLVLYFSFALTQGVRGPAVCTRLGCSFNWKSRWKMREQRTREGDKAYV